ISGVSVRVTCLSLMFFSIPGDTDGRVSQREHLLPPVDFNSGGVQPRSPEQQGKRSSHSDPDYYVVEFVGRLVNLGWDSGELAYWVDSRLVRHSEYLVGWLKGGVSQVEGCAFQK